MRRCLVLLADHELNASTFVARCIASTGATPYAVVSGALAALSGRRHGGASARAEALFRELGDDPDPMAAMAARLARGDDLPGLGQPLYPEGDPRALAIVEAIAKARPETGKRVIATAAAAKQLTGLHPNVDFALGATATALGLPQGAALGLFLVARSVGWLAHAIEQYESGVLIRPRARYTGRALDGRRLAQALALELEVARVGDKAIQHHVGEGWLADQVAPILDRDPADDQRAFAAAAFLHDLHHVVALARRRAAQAPNRRGSADRRCRQSA